MRGVMTTMAVALLLGCGPLRGQDAASTAGEDALEHIRWAVDRYPVVLLGEGNHGAAEPHALLRRILGDDQVLDRIDVIVVEFACATFQDVLDRFIRGEEVPRDVLSAVWRNTSTSPVAPWESPLYEALLKEVRDANRGRPDEGKVRVVAGDPPIDWPSIRTGADYSRAIRPRDPYAASVVLDEVRRGNRVLVVYGGHHLQRLPLGPGDSRNPMTSYILPDLPESVWAVEFLWPRALGIASRTGELVHGRAYRTATHWVGSVPASLQFAGTRSLVTDPRTGERSWQEVPLYEGRAMRELYDALIYIGSEDQWTVVPPELDPVRDAEYIAELERRRVLRFGGGSSGR